MKSKWRCFLGGMESSWVESGCNRTLLISEKKSHIPPGNGENDLLTSKTPAIHGQTLSNALLWAANLSRRWLDLQSKKCDAERRASTEIKKQSPICQSCLHVLESLCCLRCPANGLRQSSTAGMNNCAKWTKESGTMRCEHVIISHKSQKPFELFLSLGFREATDSTDFFFFFEEFYSFRGQRCSIPGRKTL